MIFLDTSGIYALTDNTDTMHAEALRMYDAAVERGEGIIIHSYVLVESAALIQSRIGSRVSLAFLNDAETFTVIWVDRALHDSAVCYLRTQGSSALSLVDAVSFQVMTDMGITKYLGFDKHFSDAGFSPYSV